MKRSFLMLTSSWLPIISAVLGGASVMAAESPEKSDAPAPPAADVAPVDITFDTLKLELKKNEDYKRDEIPKKVEALGNRRIRIRGYLLPSFQQTGLTQFVLVRDNMQCCFGPGAALHDAIVVEMKPGQSTDFTVRPVAVEGIFAIKEFLDPDGKVMAIYHLDGERVR